MTQGRCIMDHDATLEQLDASDTPSPLRALQVESICKAFGEREVLQGLSLRVSPGEIVGLLGADGEGKTLCFDLIMGFRQLDAGRILLGDTDVSDLTPERRAQLGLTYLPQDSSIFRGMTVEQNIESVLEICEPDAGARPAQLEAILGALQLTHLRDVAAISLSGGERRRTEIARALAARPSVMLLDEPFAGIDPLAIEDIKRALRTLKARNVGLLISDQNLHDVLELVQRVYVIHDGRAIFSGTPGQMISHAEVRRFYLGGGTPQAAGNPR